MTSTDKSHWLSSTDPAEGDAIRTPGVRRGFKHPLAMVAAGLVLAIVVWNLFRAPTTEVEGLVGDLAVASPAPSTVVDAADDAEPADGAVTTTTRVDDPESSVVEVSSLDPALTRYDLFAQQSGRLLRIDLSDGAVVFHEVAGRLLGEFAGSLYFLDPTEAIIALPADDLEADPVPVVSLVEPGEDVVSAVLTSDGIVHLTIGVFGPGSPELTMVRVDLLTRSEQQVDVAQFGTFGLVEVPGAGLFELTASGGFQPLVDGSPRFYGERLIVIEECEAPDRCRRYWFDRVTGEEVDRPVPAQSTGWLLGPSGRIAVAFDRSGRVFIDTETGETLPDLAGFESNSPLPVPDDLSPDERFLAVIDASAGGDVRVFDLLRNESWTLELPRTFNVSRVIFVPRPIGGDG